MQILEAFRALNALNEDTFDLDADGINQLSDFKNNDDLEDDISIIDPEAETEDDLQDNYIGKVILDCCVCHSKLYKDKSEIEIDETGELANVGEECPYCYTSDGFKVIGEVVAFDGDSEDDAEEESTSDRPSTASDLGEEIDSKDSECQSKSGCGDSLKESYMEVDTITCGEESYRVVGGGFNTRDALISVEDENGDRKRLSSGDVFEFYTFLDRKGNVIRTPEDFDESLTESVNNVNVETDDSIVTVSAEEGGKVTVSTEPVTANSGETIEPISPETEAELTSMMDVPDEDATAEPEGYEEIDVPIDEVDEDSFDESLNSYFKKAYENVNSYRTTGVKSRGNTLIVEGRVRMKDNKVHKTSFILEAKDMTRDGRVRFVGGNRQLTENKKAFTVTGRVRNNKLITESMSYNYRAKNSNGKMSRVYGITRTSNRRK